MQNPSVFPDDRKYDEQGNHLQVEIQQPLVQVHHSPFCSTDNHWNLLEEEKTSVENPEMPEKCSDSEADSGGDIPGLLQQPGL